jgi:alpha-galactosidase
MTFPRLIPLLVFACGTFAAAGHADEFVKPSEVNSSRSWASSRFGSPNGTAPFSFKLGDESSVDVLARSKSSAESKKLDENRTQHTLTWTDAKTGLETKVIAIEYADYPSVEWTVYFKNTGSSDTPILSEIAAVDVEHAVPASATVAMHHMKGSRATPEDFQPFEKDFPVGTEEKFTALGGRGTNGDMPYFNLNWGNQGLIVVMGWPGQWNLTFRRSADGFDIQGGQEKTHFKLTPGESARTPLIVVQPYEGDWMRGQNVWRRWSVAHVLPRPNGKLAPTQLVACSSHQFGEMINANEENQKQFIDRYLEEEFPLAYWWMDAGWYENDGVWTTTGTWEVDKKRFPNGLRAITDHAREKGLKSIVWFEPERVAPNTWLWNEHPEWLLSGPAEPGDQLFDPKWKLLNLGNHEARTWLINHITGLIKKEGIDLYRQDFNMDPLMFWRKDEPEDRQGIAENHYIEGYLAYWDAILAINPGMRIDTCSSGGRRLDLETLRRSVPFVRSDCLFEPTSQQAHSYGLSLWLPYHGTGTLVGKSAIGQNTGEGVSEYDFRSHMASSVTACWDMRDKTLDYDALRRLVSEMAKVSPLFKSDYYPLTPHSLANDQWIAWQYNSPESGEAVVQAYRRPDNSEDEKALKLHGLDPQAEYEVDVLGHDHKWTASGKKLMDQGLDAKLDKRSAGLYFITKK